jgi:anti-anti-sigma factor
MRVSVGRQTRLKRLADRGEHTSSPAMLVLPSLLIHSLVVQMDSGPEIKGTATPATRSGRAGEATKVVLRGELDALTADRGAEFLLGLLAEHPPTIVLDVSELTFCDAGGLSAFVRLANRAEAAGGGVSMIGVRPMLAKQLRITGLDRRFPAR